MVLTGILLHNKWWSNIESNTSHGPQGICIKYDNQVVVCYDIGLIVKMISRIIKLWLSCWPWLTCYILLVSLTHIPEDGCNTSPGLGFISSLVCVDSMLKFLRSVAKTTINSIIAKRCPINTMRIIEIQWLPLSSWRALTQLNTLPYTIHVVYLSKYCMPLRN